MTFTIMLIDDLGIIRGKEGIVGFVAVRLIQIGLL